MNALNRGDHMDGEYNYKGSPLIILGVFFTALVMGLYTWYFAPAIPELLLSFVLIVGYWAGCLRYQIQRTESLVKAAKDQVKQEFTSSFAMSLRKFRHIFVNDAQVIYSLSQLNSDERMLTYVERMNHVINVFGDLLNLPHYDLMTFFMELYTESVERGYEFHFYLGDTWDTLQDDGEHFAQLMRSVFQSVDLEEKKEKNGLIEWELDGNNSQYIVVLTIYDETEPWKQTGSHCLSDIEDLKSQWGKDGIELDYYCWDDTLAVHMFIPRE